MLENSSFIESRALVETIQIYLSKIDISYYTKISQIPIRSVFCATDANPGLMNWIAEFELKVATVADKQAPARYNQLAVPSGITGFWKTTKLK